MNESKELTSLILDPVSIILFTLLVCFSVFIYLLKAITVILCCMAFWVAFYTCATWMQSECNFIRFWLMHCLLSSKSLESDRTVNCHDNHLYEKGRSGDWVCNGIIIMSCVLYIFLRVSVSNDLSYLISIQVSWSHVALIPHATRQCRLNDYG